MTLRKSSILEAKCFITVSILRTTYVAFESVALLTICIYQLALIPLESCLQRLIDNKKDVPIGIQDYVLSIFSISSSLTQISTANMYLRTLRELGNLDYMRKLDHKIMKFASTTENHELLALWSCYLGIYHTRYEISEIGKHYFNFVLCLRKFPLVDEEILNVNLKCCIIWSNSVFDTDMLFIYWNIVGRTGKEILETSERYLQASLQLITDKLEPVSSPSSIQRIRETIQLPALKALVFLSYQKGDLTAAEQYLQLIIRSFCYDKATLQLLLYAYFIWYCKRAIQVATEVASHSIEPISPILEPLCQYADVLIKLKRFDKSKVIYMKALPLTHKLKDKTQVLYGLSRVCALLYQYEEATKYLQECIRYTEICEHSTSVLKENDKSHFKHEGNTMFTRINKKFLTIRQLSLVIKDEHSISFLQEMTSVVELNWLTYKILLWRRLERERIRLMWQELFLILG